MDGFPLFAFDLLNEIFLHFVTSLSIKIWNVLLTAKYDYTLDTILYAISMSYIIYFMLHCSKTFYKASIVRLKCKRKLFPL